MSQQDQNHTTSGALSPPISTIPVYPPISPHSQSAREPEHSPQSARSVDSRQALLSPAPFPSPSHLNYLHPYVSPHPHTRFAFEPYQPQSYSTPDASPAPSPLHSPVHVHHQPHTPGYQESSRVPAFAYVPVHAGAVQPELHIRRRSRSRSRSPQPGPDKAFRRKVAWALVALALCIGILAGVFAFVLWSEAVPDMPLTKAPSQAVRPVPHKSHVHGHTQPDQGDRKRQDWRRVESLHEMLHLRGSHDGHPVLKQDTHAHPHAGVEVPAPVEYVDALGHAHPSLDPEVERAAGLFDTDDAADVEGVAYRARGSPAMITQKQLRRQRKHVTRAMVTPGAGGLHRYAPGVDELGVPWQGGPEDADPSAAVPVAGAVRVVGAPKQHKSQMQRTYATSDVPWQGGYEAPTEPRTAKTDTVLPAAIPWQGPFGDGEPAPDGKNVRPPSAPAQPASAPQQDQWQPRVPWQGHAEVHTHDGWSPTTSSVADVSAVPWQGPYGDSVDADRPGEQKMHHGIPKDVISKSDRDAEATGSVQWQGPYGDADDSLGAGQERARAWMRKNVKPRNASTPLGDLSAAVSAVPWQGPYGDAEAAWHGGVANAEVRHTCAATPTSSNAQPLAQEYDEHGHQRAWVRGHDVVLVPCVHGHLHERSLAAHTAAYAADHKVTPQDSIPGRSHTDTSRSQIATTRHDESSSPRPPKQPRAGHVRVRVRRDSRGGHAATQGSTVWPAPRTSLDTDDAIAIANSEDAAEVPDEDLHLPTHSTDAHRPPPQGTPSAEPIPVPAWNPHVNVQ